MKIWIKSWRISNMSYLLSVKIQNPFFFLEKTLFLISIFLFNLRIWYPHTINIIPNCIKNNSPTASSSNLQISYYVTLEILETKYLSTFASTLERCLLVLEPCFERFSNFTGVWIRDYYIFTSNEASFRDRARSFCGKNMHRFVRDRREHVFRPVSNLTGYHGLGRSFYETPPSIAPSSGKEGTSVARMHLDHCEMSREKLCEGGRGNRFEIWPPWQRFGGTKHPQGIGSSQRFQIRTLTRHAESS